MVMRKDDVLMKKGKAGAVIALSLVMGVSLLSGCSSGTSSGSSSKTAAESASTSKSSSENSEENKIYGVISSVSSDSITINVGTLNKQSKPDETKPSSDQTTDQNTDKNSAKNTTEKSNTEKNAEAGSEEKSSSDTGGTKSGQKSSSEAPAEKSMITTTGETKTVTLTSSTKVSQEMPGNPPQEGAPGNGQQPLLQNGSDSSSSTEKSTDNNSNEKQSDNSTEANGDSDPNGKDTDNSSNMNKESQSKELSISDLKENDEVSITLDSDENASEISLLSGGGPGGDSEVPQGGSGQSAAPTSYTSVTEYSTDKTTSGKSYSSTGTDENAVHVTDGAKVCLKDVAVSRKSEESQGGDCSSFYGIGAAVLTTDGTSYISGSKISTDAKGGAGIFSYGDGTTYVSDTTVSTKKDTSGGLHAAGGGTLYAWNVNATTQGESSAAIRSDRGGGTMVVDGGTYTSNGTGSPAVYSTANIAVHNADLTSNNSESVCIEGLNSLRLFDCNLTGNMKKDSQNDCKWNVILYQSMSGDSEVGNSTFEMNGGTLTAKNGGMFYTTNTECTIALKDVDITYNDDSEFFLQCTGNNNQRGWGQSGANGSDCNFTADSQDMKGNVIWDSISDLDFYMTNGSTLEGAFVNDESNAGNGGDGYCNVVIDKDSTWTVTGDSTITSLSNAGTITDADGKTVSIVGTDGTTYVEGDSDYTITVGSYQDSADTSASTTVDDWSNYEIERPESL